MEEKYVFRVENGLSHLSDGEEFASFQDLFTAIYLAGALWTANAGHTPIGVRGRIGSSGSSSGHAVHSLKVHRLHYGVISTEELV